MANSTAPENDDAPVWRQCETSNEYNISMRENRRMVISSILDKIHEQHVGRLISKKRLSVVKKMIQDDVGAAQLLLGLFEALDPEEQRQNRSPPPNSEKDLSSLAMKSLVRSNSSTSSGSKNDSALDVEGKIVSLVRWVVKRESNPDNNKNVVVAYEKKMFANKVKISHDLFVRP